MDRVLNALLKAMRETGLVVEEVDAEMVAGYLNEMGYVIKDDEQEAN